jgi:competence protein ComEC
VTTLVVCAAALLGIAVTTLTRPLAPQALLLAAGLSVMAVPLVWRKPHARRLAVVACALSLGAARGGLPEVLLASSGAAPPGAGPGQNLVAALAPVREAARHTILSYLPEPQASLAAGVLLGGSGHLDPAFRRELERSGLGHLVAIDGFKQVVVAAAVGALATRVFGARIEFLPILVAIGGYTLISGAHPSAVRAALMVGLAQVAAAGGRLADPLTSLALAILGMALLEPRVLLDVGLQLSASATLGIVLLWPVLRRWLRLRKLPKLIAEPLGLTLAVTLACLPVMLSSFQVISVISPLAHIVAVPLLAPVLVSAALLALAGAAPVPPLVAAAAWLAWLPASLLAVTIHVFGSLPGAALSTGRAPPVLGVALAGALLGCGVWHLPEFRHRRYVWSRWRVHHRRALVPAGIGAACLGAAAVLSLTRGDGRLSITRLPLSAGQAVFIRGPTGQTTLVVTGRADSRALADRVADHLALWEHKLDRVVVLDPGAEKALGLTLARYPADELTRASSAAQVPAGPGQTLTVASERGQLLVSAPEPGPTSGPTTSAARPGSAD